MNFLNVMQFKAYIKQKAAEKNISPQLALQTYMLECLLIRIAHSKYKKNFILKGGFLISIIAGLNSRTTMDIDASIKGIKVSQKRIKEIFQDICKIDLKDNIRYSIVELSDIRKDDEYGGIRVSMKADYDVLSVALSVDITTGDKITPREIDFAFNPFFNNEKIHILTYNMETFLAEKIETVISRGIANTRIRDFYDIYLLLKIKIGHIDKNTFQKSLTATCIKRNSLEVIKNYETVLKQLEEDRQIQKLWIQYQKKFTYAKDISLIEIYSLIKKYLKNINF